MSEPQADVKAGPGALTQAVAEALVDALLTRPPHELLPPERLAPLLRELSLAALRSPRAEEAQDRLLQAAVEALRGHVKLRQSLRPQAAVLLRELIALPYVPDRTLLVGLLTQRPFQRIARELMVGTLLDYSRRLRATVGEGAPPKSMGMLGRLATEAVRKSTSALGTIAPGVTSAVSDEFERQLQRRAAEFADGAVEEMVQRAAGILTDPARAAEHVEMKLALLDFVLDRPGPVLARELERMQLGGVFTPLRAALAAWLEREQATSEINAALLFLQQHAPAPTLHALLEGFGALPAARAILGTILASGLQPLLDSGELRRLMGPG